MGLWVLIIAGILINNNKQEKIMATLDEVKAAIAQEKQEVMDKLASVNAELESLKEQLANGTVVTAADLDELKGLINDIFVA